MSFDFFKNAMNSGLAQLPNESIRDRQQAAISSLYDVTTNRYLIKEQDDIGTTEYHEIEAWIGNGMGMTTRGAANGDDFKTLTFESLEHQVKRGLYYYFDDNVWLTNSTDRHSSLDVTIGVRRCNNVLKMIDPENGSVFSIPCVLAYEMTAPNVQVTSAILTPNDHNKVLVQGNKDTFRLFKTNTRFVLEGRVFKLFAFQDAINDEHIAPLPTMLTLDLFLDEIHANDDIENQIADNGRYDYSLTIDSTDMELINGVTGSLDASIALNGEEVKRKVIWESSNPKVVAVTNDGGYKVFGNDGDLCTIKAVLDGNDNIYDTIEVKVASSENLKPKIIVEPSFDRIRQFETINFEVMASYGGKVYTPSKTSVELINDAGRFMTVQKDGNKYKLTGNAIAKEIQTMRIFVENQDPLFTESEYFAVKPVSMMG